MIRFFLTLFLLLCILPCCASPTRYRIRITPLPELDVEAGNAYLNSNGMVACGDKVWQNGRVTDLNTLLPARSGWVLTEADAINDRGQIVCAGNKGACLLTPIGIERHRL